MKYSEYKEKQKDAVKAFKMINGLWTLLAYLISYRMKELLLLCVVLLLSWIVIMMVNPNIAFYIKQIVLRIL